MSKLKEFTTAKARPLPVIILADVSGSMGADGKIGALNMAMKEMIDSFGDESDLRAQIEVAIVTFGGGASVQTVLKPASEIKWSDMSASGGTPMGAAFSLAQQMIEDTEIIPGRAYRPTIVLVSDGQPTDSWEEPLRALLTSERASKAFRMALAIGDDADHSVLEAFLNAPESKVFSAMDARQIQNFFKFVTMSVTSRSRSTNPNLAPVVEDEGWDL
jgi:uncharacterized protein YegL